MNSSATDLTQLLSPGTATLRIKRRHLVCLKERGSVSRSTTDLPSRR